MSEGAGRFESAVAAGVLASEEQFGRLLRPRSSRWRVPSSARRRHRSSSSTRRRTSSSSPRWPVTTSSTSSASGCPRRPRASRAGRSRPAPRRSCSTMFPEGSALRPRDVAEGTGYVPQGLMAVPLLDDEEVLGVLQGPRRRRGRASPCRRWSCSASSPARPRSRSPSSARPAAPRPYSRRAGRAPTSLARLGEDTSSGLEDEERAADAADARCAGRRS